MSIEVDEHDDVTVVTVNGEIDLDTSDEFGLALVGGATMGRVDVDLTGVSYIDSAGLRSLLTARTELEKQGMQMPRGQRLDDRHPAVRDRRRRRPAQRLTARARRTGT